MIYIFSGGIFVGVSWCIINWDVSEVNGVADGEFWTLSCATLFESSWYTITFIICEGGGGIDVVWWTLYGATFTWVYQSTGNGGIHEKNS